MADDQITTPPAAPAAPAADAPRQPDNQPIMAEYAPFGGDPSLPQADTALIMSTLFADTNSAGDQGDPAKPADGKVGVAAPSPTPPAQPAAPAVDGQAAQPAGGTVPEAPAFPGASGSQPQGGAPAPAAPAAAPAAAPPAAPALPPEVALELHNLRGMVQQQGEQLRRMAQPGAQPAPAPGGSTPQPGNPATEMEKYRVDLAAPPQLADALFGDDRNQAMVALNVLLSATATNAVSNAMKHMTTLVDDRFTSYSGTQAAQAEGEKIMREYYEAFPSHNNPLYDQVIQQQWQQLFSAMPGLQWGPDARNALGARVAAALNGLGVQLPLQPAPGQPGGPAVQQQEQPAVTTTPPVLSAQPARPAAFMDSGTRPAQSPGAGNFIAETLG